MIHTWQLISTTFLIASVQNAEADRNTELHPCARECVAGQNPMTCEYSFLIETYTSMSKACYDCPFNMTDCDRDDCVTVDGFARLIYTIDRQLPSPQIRVCENDIVKVRVSNHMGNGEGTSIHWHGIHQVNTAYMDGVGMLTQCPILPLTEFEYKFQASPAGTHFYHAHVGFQRGEGLAGPLIVKPLEEPHASLYQHDLPDHTVMVQDWFSTLAYGQAVLSLHAKGSDMPGVIIINGRAAGMVSWPEWNNNDRQPDTRIPYPTFNVNQNEVYRFRVISNAVMNCPVEMYIEGHSMLVIASDGGNIEPTAADVVIVAGGERYDVVVTANATTGNYWMYFRGITDCIEKKAQSLAVLHYDGAVNATPNTIPNTYDERPINLLILNPFSRGIVMPDPADKHITLTELKSAETEPDWLKDEPTTKVFLQLGLHRTDNPLFNVPGLYSWAAEMAFSGGGTFLAQINRVYGVLPSWPYLSQYDSIPQSQFCDVNSPSINESYCAENFCQCTHRLRVQLGEVVEIIMLDRGKQENIANHPMHIHGQWLHILAIGQNDTLVTSKELVEELDARGGIARNTDRPIRKDTIMMPDGGYVVGRFRADNPGVWFLHCHNEVHVRMGMSMVIEVGNPEDWPQDPQDTYRCGAYPAPSTGPAPMSTIKVLLGTACSLKFSSVLSVIAVIMLM